jgi:hypothetical protein
MSYSKHHHSIDCDGGGWKGCLNYFAMLEGESLRQARLDAKTEGWKYVKDDTGEMLDLCPACGMNV